jgi:hypothetical protein
VAKRYIAGEWELGHTNLHRINTYFIVRQEKHPSGEYSILFITLPLRRRCATPFTWTFIFSLQYIQQGDTRWRSWLRHCITSRQVARSIPDGVIGIFHWHNPSVRIMALGSLQPLTEMSTSNISWGVKAAGAYGWQPYHLHVPTVFKFVSRKLLEPGGPVQACNAIPLPFTSSRTVTETSSSAAVRIILFNVWLLSSQYFTDT